MPRERRAGRRSARGSLGDELEAVRAVADLPALLLDLSAQAVGLVEVAAGPGRFAPLGQHDQLGGHLDRLGQRAETEQLETPAQRRRLAARTPVVEERERLRRVE